jgi:prefoldin subunit 5
MSDDNIQVDEQVVEQLTGVADTMAKLLDQVMERHENQTKDMDHFRDDLALVRDSIRHIAKVLHEGNGERPLIARVAVLEEQVENLDENLKRVELYIHEANRQKSEMDNIDKKGKWGLVAALVTGATALGVEIARLFM